MLHVLNWPVRPNLIACLLTASLAVCLMPGCGDKTPETVTAESSGLVPAEDDEATDAPVPEATAPETSSPVERTNVPAHSGIPTPDAGSMPGTPAQPPVLADEADPAVIPDGTPAELVEYIAKLAQRTPRGRTDDEIRRERVRTMEARVKAADKILAGQAEPQYRMAAVRAKLESIGVLMQLGDETALQRFNQFAETVAADADLAIAQLGRLILFGGAIDGMMAGNVAEAVLLEKLEALLAEGVADQLLLEGTFRAARALMQLDKPQAAAQALTLIGNAFKENEDAELAKAGRMMLEQARVLPLQAVLSAVLAEQPGTLETFTTMVTALLADERSDTATITSLMSMVQEIEFAGQTEAAAALYGQIGQAMGRITDPEMAEAIGQSLRMAQTRGGLIGKPLEIVGQLLDGTPFDGSKYRGKVVLVDFWATWCRPCLAEIPNMRANYEKYHERGFEVVGVNLDDNPQDVERFLARQPLPWVTVMAADETARGFENPNAVRCGVEAIPFLVLIGADGNVAALHVRGPKLGAKLAELLGSAETPAP